MKKYKDANRNTAMCDGYYITTTGIILAS